METGLGWIGLAGPIISDLVSGLNGNAAAEYRVSLQIKTAKCGFGGKKKAPKADLQYLKSFYIPEEYSLI